MERRSWELMGAYRWVQTGMGSFAAEAWGAKEAPMTVEQSVGGVTNVVSSLPAEEEEANELTGHCSLDRSCSESGDIREISVV